MVLKGVVPSLAHLLHVLSLRTELSSWSLVIFCIQEFLHPLYDFGFAPACPSCFHGKGSNVGRGHAEESTLD